MTGLYKNFDGYDRFDFPEGIYRVTAGNGGESFLIDGDEKTGIYDCGMAYCHRGLIENIERVLKEIGKDKLDYVFMSHTHYDHIGALPYIIERWPEVCVVGAEKAKKVFESEGAKKTMERLGTAARGRFAEDKDKDASITAKGMRVDMVVKTGDSIDLGNRKVVAYETKGHTDCSITYFLEPDKVMFASESTGVLRAPGLMHTAILKDYDQTIESVEICRNLGAKQIIGNHYGVVPEFYTDEYFDLYIRSAEDEKNYILELGRKGLDYDGVLQGYRDKYWSYQRALVQPEEAFMENARYTTRHIIDKFLK